MATRWRFSFKQTTSTTTGPSLARFTMCQTIASHESLKAIQLRSHSARSMTSAGPSITPTSHRKIPRVGSVNSSLQDAKEPLRLRQGFFEYTEDEASASQSHLLTKKEVSRESAADGGGLLIDQGLRVLLKREFWTMKSLMSHLMPRDYTRTCLGTYESYAKATMVSSMLGTAASVLSMQALLTSVGVSAQSSIPLAATLNWVLKDGLGQLGGVIFASTMNTRFDADPKRFRFGADAVLALSVVLESCTVLIPWLFLPLASIANVGKNAAWLSASATRASIHQSFCLEHNLADVTGKAGSQTITASLVGTALGIAVTPLLHNDALSIILATTAFSLMHLSASYSALHHVQLRTFNIQRAWLALSPALVSFRLGDQVSNQEPSSSLVSLDWDKLASPESVATKERIIHFGKWGTQDGRARLASPPTAQKLAMPHDLTGSAGDTPKSSFSIDNLFSTMAPVPYMKSSLHVNPSLEEVKTDTLKRMIQICNSFDDQHLIEVVPQGHSGEFTVKIFYLADALPVEVLSGFLHAALVIRSLRRLTQTSSLEEGTTSDSFHQLVYDIRDRMQRENTCAKFYYKAQDKGWDTKHVFIEESKENRVHLLDRPRERSLHYRPQRRHPHSRS